MYVGIKMLKKHEFATVTPDTPIYDAEKLMLEAKLWMLLVVDENDKLQGYVRKEDVKAALPSIATTLSKHELNYELTKLKISKILRTDVPSVGPETEIEQAAMQMHADNLAGLAVVNGNKELLGFINRSVMLEILIEEMGLKQGGSRIAFEVEDRTGVLHEVSGIIAGFGISIIATGTYFHNNRRLVVFRVKTDDPSAIIKALEEREYNIVGPDYFAKEWA